MRRPRLKPEYQNAWHHIYNRTAGTAEDRPFGAVEKEMLVRLLRRVGRLYTVSAVSYQFMSNHFHLIAYAPSEVPSEEETCRRFAAFHDGKKTLRPGTALCRQWQSRLRDVSWFVRHFEHLFTLWFNRTRPVRRRGVLWAGRFKNTVLEDGAAVWSGLVYVENNAKRAAMVDDPARYRFCSYGAWEQRGRHPFEASVRRFLLPALGAIGRMGGMVELLKALRRALASRPEVAAAARAEDRADTFSLTAHRRVRHWVDGVAIGSELFVREAMARVRPLAEVLRRRLPRAAETGSPELYCWQRLRAPSG